MLESDASIIKAILRLRHGLEKKNVVLNVKR